MKDLFILYTPIHLCHRVFPQHFWNSKMYEFQWGLVLWSPMVSSIHKQQSQCSSITHADSNELMSIENGGYYGHEESNSEL